MQTIKDQRKNAHKNHKMNQSFGIPFWHQSPYWNFKRFTLLKEDVKRLISVVYALKKIANSQIIS